MFCSKCGANVAEGTAFCSSCGMPVAGYSVAGQAGGAAPPPAGGYAPAAAAPGGYAPQYAAARPTATYAGFWLRFVAAIIDGLVLAVPMVPVYLIMFADIFREIMNQGADARRNPFEFMSFVFPRAYFLSVIYVILSWLYWSLQESSSWQATLGKKALGLSVTDLQGNRLSFGRATGRFFAGRGATILPSLGGLYFFISSICAGFTEKKQALSDMIAGCLVIRKI